jgi:hypothetical protein
LSRIILSGDFKKKVGRRGKAGNREVKSSRRNAGESAPFAAFLFLLPET